MTPMKFYSHSFRVYRAAGFAALLIGSLMEAPRASAQTFSSWSPIDQGVDISTATETGSDPQQMYAIRIDLDTPGISFETTPTSSLAQSEGGETISQTTSSFLQSVGAQVAINGNFFSDVASTPQPETLSGLAVSNGTTVAASDPNFQSLFLTANNIATIGSSTTNSIYNAVSGVQVLQNGVALSPNTTSGDPTGLDPRTDVGVSQNGEYLYLLAVDGRSSSADGITDLEAGQVLQQLGAYNGLNLDGGGSTTMVTSSGSSGYTVVNNPSGGSERLDGNNLAVFANALVQAPVSTSGKYSQAVLNDNPALYYQLNETTGTTAYDSSGNGVNGTYPSSGTTLGQSKTPITSQANTSVAFNGTSGTHVAIPYNSSMSAGSFTIAAWADPTTNPGTGFAAVVSERNDKGGGSKGNAGFILYDGSENGTSTDTWQFWLGGSTTLTYNYEGRNENGLGLGPTVATNQWQFVVGTFSATSGPDANGRYTGTEDLYLNGVLELSLSGIQYLPDTSTPMYIGAGANETNPSDSFDFNGNISQVALFDSALSTAQIDALYTAAVPEPSSYTALLVVGLGVLLYFQRRKTGARAL